MEIIDYQENKIRSFTVYLDEIANKPNNLGVTKKIIRRHISLVVPEFNIGFLKCGKENDYRLELNVIFHPRSFINKTNFLYRRDNEYFKFIMNIYT